MKFILIFRNGQECNLYVFCDFISCNELPFQLSQISVSEVFFFGGGRGRQGVCGLQADPVAAILVVLHSRYSVSLRSFSVNQRKELVKESKKLVFFFTPHLCILIRSDYY